jgi:hypothetical protein
VHPYVRDNETCWSPLAMRDGAAHQHTRTNVPVAAADRARRGLHMDARVPERTTNGAVQNERCPLAGAGEAMAMAGGAAARLLPCRRVRAALPIISCALLCRLPAGTAAAAGGGRPCGTARRSVLVVVLDGRVRAGAEQRGRCVGVAFVGRPMQRRRPAGTAAPAAELQLTHPDLTNGAPTTQNSYL